VTLTAAISVVDAHDPTGKLLEERRKRIVRCISECGGNSPTAGDLSSRLRRRVKKLYDFHSGIVLKFGADEDLPQRDPIRSL